MWKLSFVTYGVGPVNAL